MPEPPCHDFLLPHPAQPLLRRHSLPWGCFILMQTNQIQSPHSTISFVRISHSQLPYTYPSHSRARYQTTRGSASCPRACWNHSNKPILSLLNLPCLFLPMEIIIKTLAHRPPFLYLLPSLTLSSVDLHGVTCPHFPRPEELFFQWQSFSWSVGLLYIQCSIHLLYFETWAIYHAWLPHFVQHYPRRLFTGYWSRYDHVIQSSHL